MSQQETEFIEKLSKHIEQLRGHAQWWSRCSNWCYLVAFLASGGATLLTAINGGPRSVVAALAVIPAIALGANSSFSCEAKTRWYWGKVTHYDALIERVQFQGWTTDRASKDKEVFDKDMQDQYPRFAMLPSMQAKRSQERQTTS
jgi:hypothetical protein